MKLKAYLWYQTDANILMCSKESTLLVKPCGLINWAWFYYDLVHEVKVLVSLIKKEVCIFRKYILCLVICV